MALPHGTTITMSLAESLIARGYGYRLNLRVSPDPFNTAQTSIAADASIYISIRHTSKSIMLIGRELIADRTDVLYTVYKDPVITAYGAPVSIFNLNGESGLASNNVANLVAEADVTNVGVEVDSGIAGAGGNPNSAGTPYTADDFKINPHDSDYLLRIHNNSGNVVEFFSLALKWCELWPASVAGEDE